LEKTKKAELSAFFLPDFFHFVSSNFALMLLTDSLRVSLTSLQRDESTVAGVGYGDNSLSMR
jgi:hypothetical protein